MKFITTPTNKQFKQIFKIINNLQGAKMKHPKEISSHNKPKKKKKKKVKK